MKNGLRKIKNKYGKKILTVIAIGLLAFTVINFHFLTQPKPKQTLLDFQNNFFETGDGVIIIEKDGIIEEFIKENDSISKTFYSEGDVLLLSFIFDDGVANANDFLYQANYTVGSDLIEEKWYGVGSTVSRLW